MTMHLFSALRLSARSLLACAGLLALGSIANRKQVLSALAKLHQAQVAGMDDLFLLVEVRKLERRGIGITDLHIIASALLDQSISIWTRDRRLGEIADQLGLRAPIP